MKTQEFVEKIRSLQNEEGLTQKNIQALMSKDQLLNEIYAAHMGEPDFVKLSAIPDLILEILDDNLDDQGHSIDSFYEDAILKLYYCMACGMAPEYAFAAMNSILPAEIGFGLREIEKEELYQYLKEIYLRRKEETGSIRGYIRLFAKNFNVEKDLKAFEELVNKLKDMAN